MSEYFGNFGAVPVVRFGSPNNYAGRFVRMKRHVTGLVTTYSDFATYWGRIDTDKLVIYIRQNGLCTPTNRIRDTSTGVIYGIVSITEGNDEQAIKVTKVDEADE